MLDHLLEMAGPAWESGNWMDGILRVLEGLDQWFETFAVPDEREGAAQGEY